MWQLRALKQAFDPHGILNREAPMMARSLARAGVAVVRGRRPAPDPAQRRSWRAVAVVRAYRLPLHVRGVATRRPTCRPAASSSILDR
jgi:hypothetical protein